MLVKIEYVISKIIKKIHLRSIKNSFIDKTSSIGAGSLFLNSNIDRHSFCGYDCTIINANIGSFCSISNNCQIGGASHTINWVSTSPVFLKNKDQIKKKYSLHEYDSFKNTIIGHDVWVGAGCHIKAGVKIGTGSVIGMGSIVTKDIPPYEIWGGNPAKFIRKRFDKTVSEKLLISEWWNFEDTKIEKLSPYICEVDVFIDHLKMEKR